MNSAERVLGRGLLRGLCAVVVVELLAGFSPIFAVNSSQQGDELVGWRGLVSVGRCFALQNLASRLNLKARAASIAQHLGDATYGIYLLHLVIFFCLAFAVFPRLAITPSDEWTTLARPLFVVLVLLVAFVLAILRERYLERPIRQLGKPQPAPKPCGS